MITQSRRGERNFWCSGATSQTSRSAPHTYCESYRGRPNSTSSTSAFERVSASCDARDGLHARNRRGAITGGGTDSTRPARPGYRAASRRRVACAPSRHCPAQNRRDMARQDRLPSVALTTANEAGWASSPSTCPSTECSTLAAWRTIVPGVPVSVPSGSARPSRGGADRPAPPGCPPDSRAPPSVRPVPRSRRRSRAALIEHRQFHFQGRPRAEHQRRHREHRGAVVEAVLAAPPETGYRAEDCRSARSDCARRHRP